MIVVTVGIGMRMCTFVFGGAALLLAANASYAAASQSGTSIDAGIQLDWTYTVPDGAEQDGYGLLDMSVMDALSRQPLHYESSALLAWLQLDRGALSDHEQTCTEKVNALASLGMGLKADIDLNEHRFVTLNRDGTIAFINPFIASAKMTFEAVIALGAKPLDWAIVDDTMTAWVLTSNPAKLVRIDLYSRKITSELPLPEGADAKRLTYDATTKSLLLAMPGNQALGIVDLAKGKPVAQILEVKAIDSLLPVHGAQDQGRALIIYHDGDVAWLDGGKVQQKWSPGRTPVAATFSAAANTTILASADGQLTVAGPGSLQKQLLQLPHAIAALASFDDGRRLLAAGGNRVTVIDLATNAVTQQLQTVPDADRIVLSDRFAYVISPSKGRASLLSLVALKKSNATPVDVDVVPPETKSAEASPVERFRVSPSGEGLLSASVSTGNLFEYAEGMNTINRDYTNNGLSPLGLAVVNYAPREIMRGHYRAVVRVQKTGRYTLIVGGSKPRFSACPTVSLKGPAGSRPEVTMSLRAKLLSDPETSNLLKIRIVERSIDGVEKPVAGKQDVRLLVYDRRSGWQRYIRMDEAAAGEYQAVLDVPRTAKYILQASSSTANMSFLAGDLGERWIRSAR
jgi:DNA-binding beta-propeller fold protein YncE